MKEVNKVVSEENALVLVEGRTYNIDLAAYEASEYGSGLYSDSDSFGVIEGVFTGTKEHPADPDDHLHLFKVSETHNIHNGVGGRNCIGLNDHILSAVVSEA